MGVDCLGGVIAKQELSLTGADASGEVHNATVSVSVLDHRAHLTIRATIRICGVEWVLQPPVGANELSR